jgi:hypothetical protein
MKKFIGWVSVVFSDQNGEASSKRVLGAFLIISGVILAFLKGEPRNVATLIISGCGLLGVGYLAEKINPGGGE